MRRCTAIQAFTCLDAFTILNFGAMALSTRRPKSINKSYTHLVRPVIFTGKMNEGGEYELEPYRFCSLGICVSGTNAMTSSYVKLWRKPVGFPWFSTCDARLLDAAGRNSEAIPHSFFGCQCWNMWEDSATELVRKPEIHMLITD